MNIASFFKDVIVDVLTSNAQEHTMNNRNNTSHYNPQPQEHTMNNRHSNVPHANAYNRSFKEDRDAGSYITINGVRRLVPNNGRVSGQDIIEATNPAPGRRTVIQKGSHVQTIDPQKMYSTHELMDKYNKPVKFNTIPDRTKGNFFGTFFGSSSGNALFGGRRTQASKACITEQVYDVAMNFAKKGIDFDEENADWVVFPHFFLPPSWGQRTSPLMIIFPTEYPAVPPIGFYLPEEVVSPHGHKFNQAFHDAYDAPTQEGWDWYCCTVDHGAWRPAAPQSRGGWRSGDNLWQYITLINEVLGNDGH